MSYYRRKSSTPLSKLTLLKLKTLESSNLDSLSELERELRSLGSYQDVVDKIARLKRDIDGYNKKIIEEKRNFQQSPGLIGAIFKTKELTTSAKEWIKIYEEKRSATRIELDRLESTSVKKFSNLKSSISCKKEYLEKIQKRILVLERKKDALESLKNKASVTLQEKRRIGASVKRRLVSNEECPYCGVFLDDNAHADHIYPISKGGESRKKNMVLVCVSCNLKKGNLTLQGFIRKYNLDRDEVESRLESLGKDI
jgi:5-methylcytosine-specific restriction endonuclease McrA